MSDHLRVPPHSIDADAVNAAKARAVIEFMDCPPEREAELLAVIREPSQGSLL